MTPNLRQFSLAAVGAIALALCAAVPGSTQTNALPTAAQFARLPAIDQVVVSPDGKHVAAITSADGQRSVISVWSTDSMRTPPKVIGSDPRVRFLSLEFLKNDRLLINGIQPFTAGSSRRHIGIQFITNLDGSVQTKLLAETGAKTEDEAFVAKFGTAFIIDKLPHHPTDVIAEDTRLSSFGDIYRVNIYTGAAKRIDRSSTKFDSLRTDLKGEIRAKQEVNYENGSIYIAQWIKNPDTGAWEEHFRWHGNDREPQELIGFSKDPNIVYVRSSKGTDKSVIYEYDVKARKLLDPIFAFKTFDSGDVIQTVDGDILGFTYDGATMSTYWTDDQMAALNKQVRAALGVKTTTIPWTDVGTGEAVKLPVADGADVEITDWSDDLKVVIVEKSGPRQPPEFYILQNGQLALLGRSNPTIDPSKLGQTKLVQYKARDGLMIPAFLTTPPADIYGPGPYPTLIEPHGGPWARDEMSWDIGGWTQYFAARGFAVLQPQFRGSEGWGQKLWRAGDAEWGQKMQDDKDDGVKWLIDQKIAAPDRVAMFGYSYGGYAALAASIRPNGLYQCAISGAGAGDLASIERATFDSRFLREFQHPTIKGMDALANASKASIPVFLYHGDRDTVVDIEQSRKFAAILKANGKPYKFLEIKDMGHQYVTMTPDMMALQLNEIEAYLRNDCGPGGI